jgi:aspartate 1-decarboxylase
MFKSKLHMATVTETVLEYRGSITIPSDLMALADLLPGERVQVLNMTSGDRLETYVIEGPAGDGNICLNGPAAHRGRVGDRVVIVSYGHMTDEEARSFRPRVIVLDDRNRVVDMPSRPASPG